MCGTVGALVASQTVEYQVNQELEPRQFHQEIFSLCMNPRCEMAYYSADYGYLYLLRDIKAELDHKEETQEKYICYCQKITYDQVRAAVLDQGVRSTKAFFKNRPPVIVEKCLQVNPFGCSCLADIKKLIDETCASA
jgi:hypothetical protein